MIASIKNAVRYSIQARLIAVTSVMVVSLVSVLGLVIALVASNIFREESGRQQQQSLEQSAALLSNFLDVRESHMKLWASSPLVEGIFLDPAVASVFIPSLRSYFAQAKAQEPWILHIFLLQDTSVIYDDSDAFAFSDGTNGSPNGLAFLASLPNDQAALLDLKQLNPKLHGPVVYFKRPFVKDGKPVPGASILLLLDFEKIDQSLFFPIQIGERGFVSVVAKNASGEMVVPPRPTTQTEERMDFLEFGRTWSGFVDINATYRSIVLRMKELPSRPFAVVGVASRNDIREPVLKLIYFSGVFGLIALMLGIWSTFFFSRRLTDPIRALTVKAEQLALQNAEALPTATPLVPGDTQETLGIEAQDELGRLASSFDRMQIAIADKINVIESQNEKLKLSDLLKEELNQSLEARVVQRTSELQQSNRALTKTLHDLQAAKLNAQSKTEQLSNLLNNSGQGFLSFGADFVIDPEFSRACESMLGRLPAGQHAADVFFRDDTVTAELFCAITAQVLSESDPDLRDSMLSLLPQELQRNPALLRVEYKVLENDKCMVVLTDITDKQRMESLLASERRRLEMIVMAVTESRNFFETSDAFGEFLARGLPAMLKGTPEPQSLVKALYREIHTFKGVLSQYSFPTTPGLLHAAETRLSTLMALDDVLTPETIAAVVSPGALQAAYDQDLAIVSGALGPEFLTNREKLVLSESQARQLAALAKLLLRGETIDTAAFLNLLDQFRRLGKVPFRDLLMGFGVLVKQTAERLEKDVAPLEIEGGADVWVDPSPYKAFFRTLVHVFRNAVAHGLELPDDRWHAKKPETGKISCSVAVRGNCIELVIADDGGGINLDALRERAVSVGVYTAQEAHNIADNELAQIIFLDNISTLQETTELAGRGVGLAAVRSETQSIGGDVIVKTVAGVGTQFLFTLPLFVDPVHGEETS
jgi:HAMP domain-containing protein/signal transduction histidine kinase